MKLFRHYKEKLYLFFLMLIKTNVLNWLFMLVTGIFEKHSSKESKISPTQNRCIYLKMGIFRYTTYGVRILFDKDPFAQSIPLTKILPRITSIHEKSQVDVHLGIVSLTFARHSVKEKCSLTVDAILGFIIRKHRTPMQRKPGGK